MQYDDINFTQHHYLVHLRSFLYYTYGLLTKNDIPRVTLWYCGSFMSMKPPVAKNTVVKRNVDMTIKAFSATPNAIPIASLSYLFKRRGKRNVRRTYMACFVTELYIRRPISAQLFVAKAYIAESRCL